MKINNAVNLNVSMQTCQKLSFLSGNSEIMLEGIFVWISTTIEYLGEINSDIFLDTNSGFYNNKNQKKITQDINFKYFLLEDISDFRILVN